MEVDALHTGGHLRVAVEQCLGPAHVEAVRPVGAQGAQERRVAAIAPAGVLGGVGEAVGANARAQAVECGIAPSDTERRHAASGRLEALPLTISATPPNATAAALDQFSRSPRNSDASTMVVT